MPTDTKPTVQPARYGGYVATFDWNDETHRVFFDNSLELARELVEACVDDVTRDRVMDAFDLYEWGATDYPLFAPPDYDPQTVAFRQPEPIDCDCEACSQGHNSLLIARQMSDLRSVVRAQWWSVAGVLVLIGLVALFV